MSDACSVLKRNPDWFELLGKSTQDSEMYMHRKPLTDSKPPLVATAIFIHFHKKMKKTEGVT